MRKTILCIVAAMMFLSAAGITRASELVYTPINPSFGGNPLNGTFLLNQAGAQNSFKEIPASGLNSANGTSGSASANDPVEQFKTQLDRMLLSGLADKLIRMAFGANTVTSGDYTMGTLKVHVDTTTDPTNMLVTITNIATGSTTSITLPIYQ